jgi:anion transporter
VATDKTIMYVLGMDVIWLNLLAFILSSMLVKVKLAKRMALWLILKFGRKSSWALLAFLILHMILAPLIPATAARTVMTLPLIVVVAAIYGATEETNNNFGRNLMLLNLCCISVLSSMTMTGSAANLIAVGLIQTMADQRVYYMDWVKVGAPLAIVTMLIMWIVGQKLIFRIPKEQQVPQLAGGLGVVEQQYGELGPLNREEKKAIAIFAVVLALWMTDVFHMRWFGVEISAPFAALLGAVLALLPRYGVLQWSEAEIPWHLLIFSAGAYAGGLALDDTGAAAWGVKWLFGGMDLKSVPFGVSYTVVIAVMMYSHLLTTSKTVRTIIMIPIIITLAKALGWNPISFALPAALCIDWVVGLPISGKPNVILYSTNLYSVGDNFKYGFTTCTVGMLLLVLFALTFFPWIGLTPDFWAVAP